MEKEILTAEQRKQADIILASEYSRLDSLKPTEIKDLAILWCYYSAKIEGNTYTYIETEALLKDNITSEKRYEDAKMIKNLYNAFVSELRYIYTEQNKEKIDEKTLYRLHKAISNELISSEDGGKIRTRAVRITGTDYIPPSNPLEIKYNLVRILYEQEKLSNPIEKAIYLHCNLARLQPFVDGNKRTARMIESIALMNNNIIPVFSRKDADILAYRKGLMHFYETGDYSQYANYFISKHIERIEHLHSLEQNTETTTKWKDLSL